MVTLIVGQMIRQKNNGRIWQITAAAPRRVTSNTARWRVTLVTPAPAFDDRFIGDHTDCSESWLHTYCEDWPGTVDPPCGDGVQVVRICESDRDVVCAEIFIQAADAVAYCAAQLAERDGTHAEWFGWEAAHDDMPDLVARLNDDGELIWAEVVHKV